MVFADYPVDHTYFCFLKYNTDLEIGWQKCGILFVGNMIEERTHFRLNSIKRLIFFFLNLTSTSVDDDVFNLYLHTKNL